MVSKYNQYTYYCIITLLDNSISSNVIMSRLKHIQSYISIYK